ncbi:hypothetical protein MPSEU_000430200 [Mayamaea pseudoterrestris]|nr:hypothetical protein MPSEU_000430200 [Mayamaea pseudoterrestris]
MIFTIMFGRRRSQVSASSFAADVEMQEMEPLTLAAAGNNDSAAPSPTNNNASQSSTNTDCNGRFTVSPPVGRWRDSLWSWCRHGPFHASIYNSICCCVLTGAGQVATRMQLSYAGQVASASQAAFAFKTLLKTTVLFWMTRTLLLIVIATLDPNIDSQHWVEPPTSYYFFCAVDDLLAYIYFGFTVMCLKNIRSHVRQKYNIPEETNCCPGGSEDTCCSLICPCLVVGQLLRHTTDYSAYPGRCCSSTGLPDSIPVDLV